MWLIKSGEPITLAVIIIHIGPPAHTYPFLNKMIQLWFSVRYIWSICKGYSIPYEIIPDTNALLKILSELRHGFFRTWISSYSYVKRTFISCRRCGSCSSSFCTKDFLVVRATSMHFTEYLKRWDILPWAMRFLQSLIGPIHNSHLFVRAKGLMGYKQRHVVSQGSNNR